MYRTELQFAAAALVAVALAVGLNRLRKRGLSGSLVDSWVFIATLMCSIWVFTQATKSLLGLPYLADAAVGYGMGVAMAVVVRRLVPAQAIATDLNNRYLNHE
jgi:hypothetical protein